MKQLTRLRISLLVALALAGPAGAQEKVTSPNAQVAHLGLHGVFTIDTRELAAKDPRNPKRIVFTEMTTASFFDDAEGKAPIHGDPIHMHLRYGDARSSFASLLAISEEGPEDKTKLDPWWSVYCAEGKSACDR